MGRRSHQKAARSASRSPIGTESSRPGPAPSTDGHFSLDGGFAPALETAGRGRKRGMPERRIVFVDAARGLAVALALYIHSLATFGSWYRLPLLGQGLVRLITSAATPTFVVLFGAMLEMVYYRGLVQGGAARVRTRLLHRSWSCYVAYLATVAASVLGGRRRHGPLGGGVLARPRGLAAAVESPLVPDRDAGRTAGGTRLDQPPPQPGSHRGRDDHRLESLGGKRDAALDRLLPDRDHRFSRRPGRGLRRDGRARAAAGPRRLPDAPLPGEPPRRLLRLRAPRGDDASHRTLAPAAAAPAIQRAARALPLPRAVFALRLHARQLPPRFLAALLATAGGDRFPRGRARAAAGDVRRAARRRPPARSHRGTRHAGNCPPRAAPARALMEGARRSRARLRRARATGSGGIGGPQRA